jgi:hypothetical protein
LELEENLLGHPPLQIQANAAAGVNLQQLGPPSRSEAYLLSTPSRPKMRKLMENGQYSGGNILSTAAAGWTVVGTGDFTGSGTSDVLLQNGGTVVDWIIKSGQYSSGNVLTTGAAGWTVAHST